MQKYKKPNLDIFKEIKNPFIPYLQIPVVKYTNRNVFRKEDELIVNDSFFLEKTPSSKVYTKSEHRLIINKFRSSAKELYLWLIYELKDGEDYIWINKQRYIEECEIKSVNTFKPAVEELIRYGILQISHIKDVYWINPDFLFKGNRINKYIDKIKIEYNYTTPVNNNPNV